MICTWFERECAHAATCIKYPNGETREHCPELLAVEEQVQKGHTRHCAARLFGGMGSVNATKRRR